MPKYYPVMLNMENKKCLVVGGGEISYRKIMELLESGALITLVSISINKNIKSLVDNKLISYIQDNYHTAYLENTYMVVAATNNNKVNHEIFKDCSEKLILINIVDDPKNCSFILPSKIRRGDLTITISTNGNSPSLSKIIREELEGRFDESYEVYLNILGDVRKEVINKVKEPWRKKEILETIVRSNYLTVLKELGEEAVRKQINEYLKDKINLL
jgi:precorrin-2 dehydrogenase/sirohydrochlorin ferrochelatase